MLTIEKSSEVLLETLRRSGDMEENIDFFYECKIQ